MAARKSLHKLNAKNPTPNPTQDDADNDGVDDDGDTNGEQTTENRRKWPLTGRFPQSVYTSDDLTRTRVKLAYQALM